MTEIRLEIGSGYAPRKGFLHLDLNPNAPHVDIVGPAFPIDLPDGCCAEIRAVDVLEHISYRETDRALREWSRLLAPGGSIYIQVPDAERIMEWFVQQPDRLFEDLPRDLLQSPLAGAEWRLLGGHADGERVMDDDDWRWNAHYSLWSLNRLRAALAVVGIVCRDDEIDTNPFPNVCAWGEKR